MRPSADASAPLVYAAAAVDRADARLVVVLSDRTDIPLGGIVGWFLLAAVIVAGLGAMVATRLSGTLTKPFATQRPRMARGR